MDHRQLVPGPRRALRAPKRTIRALREFVEEDGPAPDELIEVRLLEEFHWTLDQLDNQDEARALRLLAARNIEAAIRTVNNAVAGHRVDAVPQEVWKLYKYAADAEEDIVQ